MEGFSTSCQEGEATVKRDAEMVITGAPPQITITTGVPLSLSIPAIPFCQGLSPWRV